MSRQYVALIGNPGTGKSALLNSLVGEVKFKSGVKYGSGLTTTLQIEFHDGIHYCDTPGLSDVKRRIQAGREIESAMKQDGIYKLVFVVTVEEGRPRPDDIATMKVVLEAIADKKLFYGIIVNKATSRIMKDSESEELMEPLKLSFNIGHHVTDQFLFLPRLDALESKDNALVPVDPRLKEFLDNLIPEVIMPSNVSNIKVRDFDKMKEELEEVANQLKKNEDIKNDEIKRQRKEIDDLKKKRQQYRAAGFAGGFASGLAVLAIVLTKVMQKK